MDYLATYKHWLESEAIDEETRKELVEIGNDDREIRERFAVEIEFGTGGLRGLLGAGTNRMNRYTVRKATEGFARYLLAQGEEAKSQGVVISHDNRRQSVLLAKETAAVFAANGIRSYIFDSLRPTPELSFAVREMNAFAGVMITASHNPAEYNGYKLYDARGCQLVPAVADQVFAEITKISDPLAVKVADDETFDRFVSVLPAELDEKYYRAVLGISLRDNLKTSEVTVVYSPQHGTGNIPVRTVLTRLGYNVIPVTEQCVPDTEFGATKNPNPESPDAYVLALEYAEKAGADIVITTDPDCDRLGVAVRRNGEYTLMTGNQSAAVLMEYILSTRKEQGTLPENGLMFNTVVTSNLGERLCASYGIETEQTLTGFKFIGEKVHEHEMTDKRPFVFGYEESYGCLIADFARDKDAVQAALMLCESAAYYKSLGKTLLDVLEDLYSRFGFYNDLQDSFYFKGLDGVDKIRNLVERLRSNPPKKCGDADVTEIEDYTTPKMAAKGFPKSNVLRFMLSDGSWCAVRPSGTEPKCKFYFCIVGKDEADTTRKLAAMRKTFEPQENA